MVVALTMALASSAFAAEPVIRSPIMQIAPWGMEENGKITGIYFEMQDAIARRAGFTPQLTIRPYVRVAAELASNVGDFTLMTENPQIQAAADRVDFLVNFDIVVLSRASTPITSIQELNGKRVSVIMGNAHYHLLDGKANFSMDTVRTTRQQVAMLALGRVDAVLGIRQALLYELRHVQGIDNDLPALAPPLLVGEVPAYVWLSKKSPKEWAPRLKAATDALRAEGKFDEISKRYR